MLKKQVKHRGTIYSGRVGARMRPPKQRNLALTSPCPRERVYLSGGPLDGKPVTLTTECGVSTMTFSLYGQTGRYLGSTWEPARA